MNSEQELLQRYGKTALLLDAAEKVIVSPIKSTATYLAEGNSESRNLAKALVAGGASISAAGAALIGMAPIVGGSALGAGAVVGALGGPITWVIVGGGAIIGVSQSNRRSSKNLKSKINRIQKRFGTLKNCSRCLMMLRLRFGMILQWLSSYCVFLALRT